MNQPRILIIEDNPDNQQLASWILEDEGFDTTCADSAEDGLALLETQSYDLVLMDISLPGMDGKQATQIIRNNPQLNQTKIIALTAHAVLEEKEAILACGVDELLTKPVDENMLVSRIKSYL